jgi:hypothetical protein
MATIPKYIIRLHKSSKSVLVFRSDGEDMTEDEAKWFSVIARNELRSEAQGMVRSEVFEYVDEFGEVQGKPHPVDKMIILFVQLRLWLGVPNKHIGAALGVDGSTISSYQRGKSQVHFSYMRAWGYMLRHEIMAIPFPLRDKVKEMIAEFYSNNKFKPWTPEEYIDVLNASSRGATDLNRRHLEPADPSADEYHA